jgi:predicted nucleic acid-binding Zn ribbon protein
MFHQQTSPQFMRQTDTSDFTTHRDREQRRFHARKPKKIGDVLAQVITARGYGRVQSIEHLAAAWQTAAGETLASSSRLGQLKRGVLEVTVNNSTVVQELTFQKQQILTTLRSELPDTKIRDLRFRVGAIN